MSAEFADAYAYCNSRTGDVLRLACAVDGSRVSHKALDLSLHLTNVSRGDTLDLLHVVEASAPSHLRPEHVMNECDLQTSTAGVQADFHRLSKSHGETVTAVLAKGAAAYRADLLVVGAIGLRIEQGNVHAHGESFSVTGSVSDGTRSEPHGEPNPNPTKEETNPKKFSTLYPLTCALKRRLPPAQRRVNVHCEVNVSQGHTVGR
jgi:nucleotide-binding universal stress UspA family protein